MHIDAAVSLEQESHPPTSLLTQVQHLAHMPRSLEQSAITSNSMNQ